MSTSFRRKYDCRHRYKEDSLTVTTGFVGAERNGTEDESNGNNQGRFEIQEYETNLDAVKLDHVGKINIAESVGKANADETNDSPSRGTATESPQERGDRSPYEKLDPKTRNEHLYIGLAKYEEIDGRVESREYGTVSYAVKLDHVGKMTITEPVEKAKVDKTNNSSSGGTAVESPQERGDRSPYEKLDSKTRDEHLYIGLAKYEEIDGRVEIRENRNVSEAVKLDHVGQINIAEPVGKAKVEKTNNLPSGVTAVDSPQERGGRSPYEKLDLKTRNEHLYIGLAKYEEIRQSDDTLRSREESVAMSAYEPIRPSLLSDSTYSSPQENNVENII